MRRAGSPPKAGELLSRLAKAKSLSQIDPLLWEWESWSADLLESQLSFPVLAFYRSQHDNQSWLAGLAAILDTCALLLANVVDINRYQVQITLRWPATRPSTWRSFSKRRHANLRLNVFRSECYQKRARKSYGGGLAR